MSFCLEEATSNEGLELKFQILCVETGGRKTVMTTTVNLHPVTWLYAVCLAIRYAFQACSRKKDKIFSWNPRNAKRHWTEDVGMGTTFLQLLNNGIDKSSPRLLITFQRTKAKFAACGSATWIHHSRRSCRTHCSEQKIPHIVKWILRSGAQDLTY